MTSEDGGEAGQIIDPRPTVPKFGVEAPPAPPAPTAEDILNDRKMRLAAVERERRELRGLPPQTEAPPAMTEPRRIGWTTRLKNALFGGRYRGALTTAGAVVAAGAAASVLAGGVRPPQTVVPGPSIEGPSTRPDSTEIPYLKPPDRVKALHAMAVLQPPNKFLRDGAIDIDPVALDPRIQIFHYLNGKRIDWPQAASQIIRVNNPTLLDGPDGTSILEMVGQKSPTDESPQVVRILIDGKAAKMVEQESELIPVTGVTNTGLELGTGGNRLFSQMNQIEVGPRISPPKPVVQNG